MACSYCHIINVYILVIHFLYRVTIVRPFNTLNDQAPFYPEFLIVPGAEVVHHGTCRQCNKANNPPCVIGAVSWK